MKAAGITEENALAILRGAFTTDPSLAELTTITDAMVDLHEVGATQESLIAVFGLVEGQLAAGVDRTLLLEEFTTITAAKADLLEAGVAPAAALDILRTAVQADPTMEELGTITAMTIDLVVDEGLSQEEALGRVQEAIRQDPTLQEFDPLVEEADRQREEPDQPNQIVVPEPVE
jgi:lipopolysaccharide biosynthesis regulator YciM